MHDLRIIREAPDRFDQALKRRGLVPQSTHILDLDRRRRAAQTALQDMLTRRNFVSKQVGDAKRKGENTTALIEEVQSLKVGSTKNEVAEKALDAELVELLEGLPNLPACDIPDGVGEDDNREVRVQGEKKAFEFEPKDEPVAYAVFLARKSSA